MAIIYVIDLQNREIGNKEKSYLKDFMQVLKIDANIKNTLLIFVLSKWDSLMHNN